MDADVIVIGSGQAGVPLADRLARAGSSVILVERSALGGTCSNYGCTPTKTMIASVERLRHVKDAAKMGITVGGDQQLLMIAQPYTKVPVRTKRPSKSAIPYCFQRRNLTGLSAGITSASSDLSLRKGMTVCVDAALLSDRIAKAATIFGDGFTPELCSKNL